ncbi:TetR/AcrR family transcriptional regulator [Mycobacterium sp. SMC-4]|uniref:TetR/AcrR family transcriptional regulator n=1 Tax=Mycobacterium sp. SMC-4 TaxID=2857059 RepID=UPI0021B27D2C|nr:TetR/AcrR family transcriptional regulator [Mycobacterium sp. SMC-4]UXA16101.1 TetR/AcrR family transcriptional regulator [Mycobacterium sp. SMC-4]
MVAHVSESAWQDRHVRNPTSGRPRLERRKRPGATARDEVLDAAAELFTTLGVAATSTRQIAEAVGIRQASLYHHFRTKDDILAALLSGTVISSLTAAQRLRARPEPPAVLLRALTLLDCRLLWESPWNVGILYLLPEVRSPRFIEFHSQRTELRDSYRDLAHRVITGLGPPPTGSLDITMDEDVVFRLVETLPNLRADGLGGSDQPQRTADLAVHALGWRGDWTTLRAASLAVIDELTVAAP